MRDPEMARRVREHLEARGDSPRDLIAGALVAARFKREQTGVPAVRLEDRSRKSTALRA